MSKKKSKFVIGDEQVNPGSEGNKAVSKGLTSLRVGVGNDPDWQTQSRIGGKDIKIQNPEKES